MCRERDYYKPYCLNDIHQQPNVFASVCIQWRNLMLLRPSFWSRINMVHVNRVDRRFIACARLSAERARPASLELHVAAGVPGEDPNEEKALADFLTSIADRHLGSLSFTFYDLNKAQEDTLLNKYLSNWRPGTLKELVIERSRFHFSHSFINPTDSPHFADASVINLPHQHLEVLWKPITVLRLQGIFINWRSQAYHRLVELCLSNDHRQLVNPPVIPDWQLVSILTSSPGLQILRFGIIVEDTSSRTEPLVERITVPVQLDHLRILDLDILKYGREDGSSLRYILHMISPGPHPLELLLPRSFLRDAVLQNRHEIHNFVLRSKVVQLGLGTSNPSLEWLLAVTPYLQTLVISSDFHQNFDSYSIPLRTINKIYILRSRVTMELFCQWLTRFHVVGTATRVLGVRFLVGRTPHVWVQYQ
ncbi:hypothetical protein RSAG8_08306, partial [Rhizoctonia solani AG-8 WAC10335]